MKKIISLILMLTIACTSVFAFTGCSGKSPLETFKDTLLEKENYEVELTINVPLLGAQSFSLAVDGNLKYFGESSISKAMYFEETEDGKFYLYTVDEKNKNKWDKTEVDGLPVDMDAIDDILSDESVSKLLDISNYAVSIDDEFVFTQREDVEFDFCKDVVLTVARDLSTCSCEFSVEFLGVECTASVVISNIGEVKLSTPKVK